MKSSLSWFELLKYLDQSGDLDRLEKLHAEIGELTDELNDKRIGLLELQSDIRRRLADASCTGKSRERFVENMS